MKTHLPQSFRWPSARLLKRFPSFILLALLAFLFSSQATAQVSITNGTALTQNFDGIGTSLALPTDWKMTNSFTLATTASTSTSSFTVSLSSTATLVTGMAVTVSSGTGALPAGTTIQTINSSTQITLTNKPTTAIASAAVLLFSNGNTVSWANTANVTSFGNYVTAGNASGNSYGYRDSTTNTDRAIGFQGSPTFASPQSIMVNYKNNSGITITDFTVTFNIERYRRNTTNASVDFYYSTDGINWTVVSGAATSNAELPTHTNAQYTFKTPLSVSKTANITGINLANGGNLYLRWNISTSGSNSQGIALDNVSTTATLQACTVPANAATNLTFPSVGTGSVSGSFTASTSSPSGYLVVRYLASATETLPVNGTTYTAGTALGAGTVVQSGTATTFTSASGMTSNTAYTFYVYAFNNTGCASIKYNTTALSGTVSTFGCLSFGSTITIDGTATPVYGSVYNTITAALSDIGGCSISQPMVIELASNYSSASETFPITLPAISGMSLTNTVTIRPAAGASNLSISGTSVGAPIININGGSFWKIDGRANGTGSTIALTIENKDISTSAASAIRLINGAQHNVITWCNLKSGNIGVTGSVSISTSTSGTGNSFNRISKCNISESTAGLPGSGASSVGTSGAVNDQDTISNNSISNFFNPTGNSYGVYVSDNTTNLVISGNSFFQTSARQLTSGTDRSFYVINLAPTNTTSSSYGITVSGNFIGGTAANCGGSAMTISDNGTASLVFRGIFGQLGTTAATSIQGNTIKNIAITSSSTSVNQSLISIPTGSYNVGTVTGNILGSTDGTNGVAFTYSGTATTPRFGGISAGIGTPGTYVIQGNTVAGLSAGASSTGAVTLSGIYVTGASAWTVANNIVGSTTNSGSLLNNTSKDSWGIFVGTSTSANAITGNTIANIAATSGQASGIYTNSGLNTISGNTIINVSSNGTAETSAIGIWAASTGSGQTISGNTVYSVSNGNASAATSAHGIYLAGTTAGTNSIDKNLVHSIGLVTTSTSGAIYGIRVASAAIPVTISNNMVRVGITAAGADISTGYAMYGINNASTGTVAHYFNTIYVGGSTVSGTTSNTFALFSSTTGNTRAYQNNVLYNARSGGSTGSHYAISVGGSGTNPTGLTINHNLYYSTGTNGYLSLYNSANLDNLSAISAANGQDAGSIVCDPKLIAPKGTSSTLDLHIQASPVTTAVEGNGIAISGITTDYDGDTRSNSTPTDIGADAGNFSPLLDGCAAVWNGSVSTDWATAGNWTPDGQVPTASTPVIISGSSSRQPVVSTTTSVESVTLQGYATLSIATGAALNVKGNLTSSDSSAVVGIGKMVMNGSTLQTISGTATVSNIEFGNTSASGVLVAAGAKLMVNPVAGSGSGLVSLLANSNVTNSGDLVLKSNTFGTAKIGAIPSTATFTGNLTLERKTLSTSGWYGIAAPFKSGTTLNEWSELNLVVSPKTHANIKGYSESDTTSYQVGTRTIESNGWKVPTALTNDINPGNAPKGYLIWIAPSLNPTYSGVLSATGEPFTQNVSATLSFTPASAYDGGGWNFISNPYPCAIDWNQVRFDASNSAQSVGNAIWMWDGANRSYGTYTALSSTTGTGVGISAQYIPSSQAFFVKASAAATITFKESHKNTANENSFMRLAEPDNLLKFTLSQGAFSDEASVLFYPGGTTGKDNFDAENLPGSGVDISTLPLIGHDLAINVMPVLTGRTIVPVSFSTSQTGNATLTFKGMTSFPANCRIYLIDNFTNTQTDLNQNATVNFTVSSATGSQGVGRFSIVIDPQVLAVEGNIVNRPALSVWPNPSDANQSLSLSLANFEPGQANITLVDALGKTVIAKLAQVNEFGTASVNLEGFAAGVYTVKVQNSRQALAKQVVVR